MKVKVAETAGFCFGVKRAVNKVYELIDTEQKPIFTLGPIIHNEGVVTDLEARGVHVITEADLDFPDDTLQNGTVVIRSHGVGKAIYDKLKEKNISYVDVTCPFVLKIHRIVEKESLAGNHIIIIGDSRQLPHIVEEQLRAKAEELRDKHRVPDAYDYVRQNILSSFKRVFGERLPVTLLREHYRCHPLIIDFCNRKYYRNELLIRTEGRLSLYGPDDNRLENLLP